MNRLIIVASIQGVSGVVQQINSIGTAAQGASRGAEMLRGGLAGLLTAAGIGQLAKYANAFTDLQNRIRFVTKSTEELTAVTGELFNISQASRSSFENTAKLYQRVALAGRNLGNSQATNLRMTELLNKATIVSGASTQEASAALIQLSQGLNSGRLGGEELRSVLEQLPYVADLIAQSLGKTRGELRAMGAEGKLTAEVVQNAILKAGQEIDAKFAKTVPTLGQAFEVLSNAGMNFVGTMDQMLGVSAMLARGMITFANNINVVAGAAVAASIAFVAMRREAILTFASNLVQIISPTARLAVQIAGLTNGATRFAFSFRAVTLALREGIAIASQAALAFALSNPITATVIALAALVPLIETYGDNVKLSADGSYTLRDAMHDVGSAVSSAAGPAMQALGDILQGLGAAFQVIVQWTSVVVQAFTGWSGQVDVTKQSTVSFSQVIYALLEGLIYMARVITAIVVGAFRGLAEVMYGLGLISDTAIEGIRANSQSILNLGEAARQAQQRIAGFSGATAASGSQANLSTPGINAYANSTSSAGSAADAAGKAIQQKNSWMLEEDIIAQKVVNGHTSLITVWDRGTASLKAEGAAIQARGTALTVSADGINAITASEAYYAEKSAKASAATQQFSGNVSSLTEDSVKPASAAIKDVGDNSASSATGTTKLADATKGLKTAGSEAAGAIKGLSEMLAASAANALKAADAYMAAAKAAREMAMARATPTGGSKVQHNGAPYAQAMTRYHSGGLAGLRPDEYSTILQKGEEVLSKDDPRNRLNNGYQFNAMLDAAGFPTDDPSKAYNADPFHTARSGLGLSNDNPNGPFDVTVWNGTSATYAQPLDEMLRVMKSRGEALPTNLTANAVRYDARGHGETMGYAQYNPWDPFGRAIAEIQATQLAAQAWGDNPDKLGLGRLEELMRLQDIWTKDFNGQWFTKNDLGTLLAQEQAKPSSMQNFQTYAPWQQGYDGMHGNYGWQPDLVATNTQGQPAGETKYEIKIEVSGAKDADSFRRNKDEIESTVMGMVRRADRRRNR